MTHCLLSSVTNIIVLKVTDHKDFNDFHEHQKIVSCVACHPLCELLFNTSPSGYSRMFCLNGEHNYNFHLSVICSTFSTACLPSL